MRSNEDQHEVGELESDGDNPVFGHSPVCPKGFTPNYKLEAEREERRFYRAMWLHEKSKAESLATQLEEIKSADEIAAGGGHD